MKIYSPPSDQAIKQYMHHKIGYPITRQPQRILYLHANTSQYDQSHRCSIESQVQEKKNIPWPLLQHNTKIKAAYKFKHEAGFESLDLRIKPQFSL